MTILCDTATSFSSGAFNLADPLWDGAGCSPGNRYCTFNGPPWFYKQLPPLTTSDIEMRVCSDQTHEDGDIGIEAFEIYVQ